MEPANCFSTPTIPAHIGIDVTHTVVELTEAEKILREAKAISLGDCYCRKTNKNRDKPLLDKRKLPVALCHVSNANLDLRMIL